MKQVNDQQPRDHRYPHPKYRNTGIGLFPIAYPGEMGFHVEDLFPEEPKH